MPSFVRDFHNQTIPELAARLSEFEKSVDPMAHPDDDEQLHVLAEIMDWGLEACRELDRELVDDPKEKRMLQEDFRRATDPWCRQSWIIHRARTKPRGFPGDYQMLLAIYDGVPLSRGIGGYLDRWCLQMTLGQAVNARLQAVKSFLTREFAQRESDVHVLDIASGPGREFHGTRREPLNAAIHMTCLDSDEGALDYVRRHVAKHAPENMKFRFEQYNALKLRKANRLVEQFGRQDVIYSVGLADYIPNRILIPMLKCWRESLNPGGCVYVSFKDADFYDSVEYQWLMDWHFLQRSEQDCLDLLDAAGFDVNALSRQRDATNVILNYVSRIETPAYRRIDQDAPAPQRSLDSSDSRVFLR